MKMDITLIDHLTVFLQRGGVSSLPVEGGFLSMPEHGKVLALNFLPSDDTFSHGIKGVEESVRIIVSFLIRKRYTRCANGMQISVNVKSGNRRCVLVKYWWDETKLRELERRLDGIFVAVKRIPFIDMVTSCSPRGVDVDGFDEWAYLIGRRKPCGLDVRLFRAGDGESRFLLTLNEDQPIPILCLREQVSRMEYDIQRNLNASLYGFNRESDASAIQPKANIVAATPNIYVLQYIRAFAKRLVSDNAVNWLLPMDRAKGFVEILTRERIRPLEVQRFSFEEATDRWRENGVVWRSDDLCNPTKDNVTTALQAMNKAMEIELKPRRGNIAYYFTLDCRALQSTGTCGLP